MGEPKTRGLLCSTLSEMAVGDYIPCNYTATKGSVGQFSSLGESFGEEIPLEGSDAPDGFFFFIKVARGLLVADRVVQHSISWRDLNYGGCIEGTRRAFGDRLIETLTSNNSPEPFVASGSSEYSVTHTFWKAFNRTNVDATDCWATINGTPTGYLQIDLGEPRIMNLFTITARIHADVANAAPKEFKILGSNDGENFVILKEFSDINGWVSAKPREFYIDNFEAYRFYKLDVTKVASSTIVVVGCWDLYNTLDYVIRSLKGGQFAPKTVPNMTNATSPAPFVIKASSEYSTTYQAWKAFNGTNIDASDCWITTNNIKEGWLQVQLDFSRVVTGFLIESRFSPYIGDPKDFVFYGSNDGVKFDELARFSEPAWGQKEGRHFTIKNDKAYSYYRLHILSVNSSTYVSIGRFELISDGMSITPENNEWSKFITNFPQDKVLSGVSIRELFNLDVMGWTQTTPSLRDTSLNSSMRVAIGASGMAEIDSTKILSNTGFRPVLEYEEV